MEKRINIFSIINLIIMTSILFYVTGTNVTEFSFVFDAVLVMIFSLIFVFRARHNHIILLIAMFIFYCNYSITISEYFVGGEVLSVPYTEYKTLEYYGLAIRTILVFMAFIAFFYNGAEKKIDLYKLTPTNNNIIFYGFIFIIIYIILFEIQRGASATYTVSITAVYGYLPIFFLFAYYYKGNSRYKDVLLASLIVISVLQDFYYGGRITSLQIIMFFAITFLVEKLTLRRILTFFFVGIIIFHMVSNYRASYSIENISLWQTVEMAFEKYLVFDTPVGAYYASATHVAGRELSDFSLRFESLWSFFLSIFTGTEDVYLSNVSHLVARTFGIAHGGGGLLPTHFYFWLGWPGVVLVSAIVVGLLNYSFERNNTAGRLVLVAIAARTPAWYLYSPTNLFRGAVLVVLVIYFFTYLFDRINFRNNTQKIESLNR